MRTFVLIFGLFAAFVGLGVFGLWIAAFNECGVGCGVLFSLYAVPVIGVCFLPLIQACDDDVWK
jgi:hypothetical protein